MLFNIGTSDCAVHVKLYGLNVELVVSVRIFCMRKYFVSLPERNHYEIIFEFFVDFFRLNGHLYEKTYLIMNGKIVPYCHFYKLSQRRGFFSVVFY